MIRGVIVHAPQPRLPARTIGDVMQTPPMAHDAHDGSPASIADILDEVLSADIEELADKLDVPAETSQAPESPEQAARRRLGGDRGLMDAYAPTPGLVVDRPQARFKELKDH